MIIVALETTIKHERFNDMGELQTGNFIAFEGIDGSGKSTQILLLQKKLTELNMKCFTTREPSASPIGSLIHQIMTGRVEADNRAVAGLFVADRVDHLLNNVDGICSKINDGITVLTDRYYFSSYAYQAVDMDMDWVINANSISAEILRPTATVFLDIDVKTAMERISKNRFHTELYEKEERLIAVRDNYFKAFEKLKGIENVIVIDADAPEDIIAQRVWNAVEPLFTNIKA